MILWNLFLRDRSVYCAHAVETDDKVIECGDLRRPRKFGKCKNDVFLLINGYQSVDTLAEIRYCVQYILSCLNDCCLFKARRCRGVVLANFCRFRRSFFA